ncbi:MAG: hypothetical protein E6Z55_05635 [Peptoniphilus harei]|nr:hypothetical protein [Peptoniphilus harei]
MNKTKFNKIALSSAYGLLILLIALNFYLSGYLRDYSIYDYNFLYALNLLIIPSLALLYFYLSKGLGKLKFLLYFLLLALFFLNIFIFKEARGRINNYEEGNIRSVELNIKKKEDIKSSFLQLENI